MTNILEKLSKKDLINVIANMHDLIKDWNNGWGLNDVKAEILKQIGDACIKQCDDKKDWNIPNVTLSDERHDLINGIY
jgi:hypothetical protein